MKIVLPGGFFSMLAILFIGLRLTHQIDWSWWLVLLPLYWWIPVALLILGAYFALALVVTTLLWIVERAIEMKRRRSS